MPPVITDNRSGDLIPAAQAEAEYGVPQQVLRQWATRGKINRFPGRYRAQATWYSRLELDTAAADYTPMPQRAPRRAA